MGGRMKCMFFANGFLVSKLSYLSIDNAKCIYPYEKQDPLVTKGFPIFSRN